MQPTIDLVEGSSLLQTAAPSLGDVTRGSVIVVDDDRQMRELLALVLVQEGYRVTVAENGLRLISALSVGVRPDLILMEVMMSWINGFELCLSLKRNPRWINGFELCLSLKRTPRYTIIPVAFVSGRTQAIDVRQAWRAARWTTSRSRSIQVFSCIVFRS